MIILLLLFFIAVFAIDHEEPYCAFNLGHYITADADRDIEFGVVYEWGDTKPEKVE